MIVVITIKKHIKAKNQCASISMTLFVLDVEAHHHIQMSDGNQVYFIQVVVKCGEMLMQAVI